MLGSQRNDFFLYTEEEFEGLKARLRELDIGHKQHLQRFGDVPGIQFHDFSSERADLHREEICLDAQASALRIKIQHARIAPKCVDDGRLTIGKMATLDRHDRDEEPREWLIVGHEETDPKATPPRLAYTSPLLDGLFEQEVGARNTRAEILFLRMPDSARLAA